MGKKFTELRFLTNFLVQFLQSRSQHIPSKNLKRLKKIITKLSLTVVYPPTTFRVRILANDSDEIRSFLGDEIERFRDKSLPFRW